MSNLFTPYIDLLRRNRNFRYLWLTRVVSLFGDWFNLIASAALIAELSGTSGLAISGLFIARLLPPFLLGPFVGVIADRFDRRTILILGDVVRAGVVLAFLVVQVTGQLWLLYTLTVLQLSISALYEPTAVAVIPQITAREDLVTANTLSGLTWSTMLALGAAVGGLTTALFGISAAFILDALTYLSSAWLTLQIVIPKTSDPAEIGAGLAGSNWQTFVEGLRYLHAQPLILMLVTVKAAGAISYGGMDVVQVTFAEVLFPLGDDGSGTLGLLYCAIGLGTGVGPIIARRLTGDSPEAMYQGIAYSFVINTVGYLLIGLAPVLSLLVLGTIMRAVGSGIGWVYSSALIQMQAPHWMMGRIFAIDLALMTLAASTSSVGAGWAQDGLSLGPHETTFILGGISLVVMFGWLARLPNLRNQARITLP